MAEAFAKAFGDGLAVEETAASGDASGDEEEDDDEQGPDGRRREDERELRRKVEELEGRIEQARDPRLKSGLQAVLAGLRDQMMDYRDAKSDAGSGEDEDSDDQDGEGEVDDDDEEDGGEEASGEEDEEGSFTDQSKGGQAGTRGQLPPIDR
ncbi:hypothetical protein VTK73DRAFT_281 [Phialemonium thermophilum]|uniref:Uncharacterized protein n=1 Tax=Phialemonium thermophilum TaxID=223376 RepID=A0ABR3VW10_9PEZI